MNCLTPKRRSVLILCLTFLLVQGCVANRGIDFGHWALTPELREFVKIKPESGAQIPPQSTMVFLPPLGLMPENIAARFRTQFALNLQDYMPVYITLANDDESSLSQFLTKDNLFTPEGLPRFKEIAGTGKIYEVGFALCVLVTDYRAYPPQKIYFQAWIVKTDDASLVTQINGSFDASEQQTVMALADYMQSRRSRSFDTISLDIMQQSPAEYADFVSAYSAKRVSEMFVESGLLSKQAGIVQAGGDTKK